MRSLILTVSICVVAGCGNDNGTSGGADLAVATDLAAAQDDLAGGGTGGTGGGGGDGGGIVISDGGVAGTGCTTACDCMPGLACFGGQCTTTANPVYCCGSTSCVAGRVCQSSTGTYGQCGGTGGQLDLAAFDPCPYIRCSASSTTECTRLGCSMCVAGTNGMVCSK